MTLHGLQHGLGGFGSNDCDQLTFIRYIKRIEPEQFARPLNLFVNGERTLLQLNANAGAFGDFVQGARDAAARRIAHAANSGSCAPDTLSI